MRKRFFTLPTFFQSYCFSSIFFGILISIFFLFSSNAYSAQVKLAWDPNIEPELAGYKMYYGTSSGKYSNIVDVGKNTNCTVSDLEAGKTYYFATTAYDTYGSESDFSNVVSQYIPKTESDTAIIEAEWGALTSPMQTISDMEASDGLYIETTQSESGTATYTFNIDNPGVYKIIARVYAPDNGSDSFYINIDDGGEFIWDLNPASDPNEFNIWREDEMTNRGTGTFDNPEYDPYILELNQGTHTITLRGRESSSKLDYFYFEKVGDIPPPTVDTDTDGDGITDNDEADIYGTDPYNADTDADEINDGDELHYWGDNWDIDYDGDGLVNLLDWDADGDGFSDGAEIHYGFDPADPYSRFQAPVVSIISPGDGASLSRRWTAVKVEASDDVNIERIELYIDGVLKEVEYSCQLDWKWQTRWVSAGQHTISAKAYDTDGNMGVDSVVVYK